jgi:hypothetical protein
MVDVSVVLGLWSVTISRAVRFGLPLEKTTRILLSRTHLRIVVRCPDFDRTQISSPVTSHQAKSRLFCLQLVIDVAFGHDFMQSLTVGMGQSISSFLLVAGDSWNQMYSDSGVLFPKEGVFTEWIYGWASAHKMSANMLAACMGCGRSPKAIGIDAVYASVSRSTLDSHGKENLFSVCILRCLFALDSNGLNCDRLVGLLICSSFCRIVQRHTRQQNAVPGCRNGFRLRIVVRNAR